MSATVGASVSASVPSWSLPQQGSLGAVAQAQTQLGQAQQIENAMKAVIGGGGASSVNNLLGAGVTMVSNLVPGLPPSAKVGFQLVGNVASAAIAVASGAAVGGPFGAVAGSLVALGELATTGVPSELWMNPSPVATELWQMRTAWVTTAGNVGFETGRPQGWSFIDYLIKTYPPKTTTRYADLAAALSQGAEELEQTMSALGLSCAKDFESLAEEIVYTPAGGTFGKSLTSAQQKTLATTKSEGALCTSVFFNWGDLTAQDLNDDTKTSAPTTPSLCAQAAWVENPDVNLKNLWAGDTVPVISNGQTLSAPVIQSNALARKPDPLYFDWRLYAYLYSCGGSWTVTETGGIVIFNCEALSMLATWCGMLAVGASTRAILSELLSQQKAIYDQNGASVGVPYLCRMMVEDVLAMAYAEAKAAASPVKQTLSKTTAGVSGKVDSSGLSPNQGAVATLTGTGQSSGATGTQVALGGVAAALAAFAGYKYLL